MSIKLRQELERRIARAFVRAALAKGYTVSINNGGDEDELTRSSNVPEILAAMFQTDDEFVIINKTDENGQPQRVGWVHFVYGNDGWDVISDYSANDATEELMTEPNRISEKYS